jgi:hypothetical protein
MLYSKTPSGEVITVGGGKQASLQYPILDLPLHESIDYAKGSGFSSFSRNSEATGIDRYGVLRTYGVDEPRFNEKGILIEESSINIFLNSDTCTTQTIAVTDGAEYTFYFLDGDGTVDLSGAVTATVISGIENSYTFTASGTSLTCTVSGTALNGQLEKKSMATSYIPTTDSAVTRAGENCYAESYDNIPTPTEGTIHAEFITRELAGYIWAVYKDGNDNFRCYIAGTTIQTRASNNGITTSFGGTIPIVVNEPTTLTVTWGDGVLTQYVNGAHSGAKTFTGDLFRNEMFDAELFFANYTANSNPATKYIRNFKTFDRALTASEVALLGGE